MFKSAPKQSAIDGGEVSTTRLETLTDGIFAIAMTLLVLSIQIPDGISSLSSQDLLAMLVGMWPKILSFIVSFIILGMFWVGHHTEFRYIKKLDHKLIWMNLFYLLFVSFLPFSAALLGRFPDNQAAIILYGVHLMIMVLIHYFMWHHASEHAGLVEDDLDPRLNKLADRLAYVASLAYACAIGLSFWHTGLSLLIFTIVPIPYIFGWIYYIA